MTNNQFRRKCPLIRIHLYFDNILSEMIIKSYKSSDCMPCYIIKQRFIMEAEYAKVFPEDTGLFKCGCYLRKPRAFGIQGRNALVPLKHIDYQLEVVNSLLHVTLAQKYENPTDKFLQVDYSFPISPNASVYKFIAEFGNVTIEGIVKEKEEAKKEYEQAKSEGRQVAMGSLDQDSKDIMQLEIGNIPPKTEFVVTISFLQEMSISLNTFYKLQIPSTISPRYTNKVEGVAKQKKQSDKPESGNPSFTWSFKIDLKTTHKVLFFDSPSHEVILLSQNELGTETTLVMQEAQVPNKDFSFLYTTQNFHIPSSVMGRTDTSASVMLSFIPKFCPLNITDAYKAEIEHESYDTDIGSARGDYVFLLDRSGSMGGTRMEKAKEALILFLKSLPEDSFFNVVSFGSSSSKMFNKSAKYDAKEIKKAIDSVKTMQANMGGTEIYQPLDNILQEKVNEGYPKHIFLLTDGGVSNTEGVIKLVKKKTKHCRVHSIGIGNGASFNLIQGCAEAGKGKHIMISDNENPNEKIIELLEATLTPIISKVKLTFNEKDVESVVPNPQSIPYILKDDVVNFFVTFKKPFDETEHFTFEYTDSVTNLPYKAEIAVTPESSSHPFVDKMSHLKVLRSLENSAEDGIAIEDQMLYVKVKDFKQEAIKYSVSHQVLSKYTSFLCVGKELVDGQLQEFMSKSVQKVHVRQPKPIQQEADLLCSLQSFSSLTNNYRGMAPSAPMSRMMAPPPQMSRPPQMMMKCAMPHQVKAKKSSGPSFGGIFDSIGSFFSGSKNSKESQPPMMNFSSAPQKMSMEKADFSYVNQQSFNRQDDQDEDKIIMKEESSSHKKEKSKKLENSSYKKIVSVDKIVDLQNPDGSWKDKALFQLLNIQEGTLKSLIQKIGVELVLTQLVVLWMEKHHPQKQFALIIKKGISWVKKNLKEEYTEERLRTELNTLIVI